MSPGVIDARQISSSSSAAPAGWQCVACTSNNPSAATGCLVCGTAKGAWSCPACTVRNGPTDATCSVCSAAKPHDPAAAQVFGGAGGVGSSWALAKLLCQMLYLQVGAREAAVPDAVPAGWRDEGGGWARACTRPPFVRWRTLFSDFAADHGPTAAATATAVDFCWLVVLLHSTRQLRLQQCTPPAVNMSPHANGFRLHPNSLEQLEFGAIVKLGPSLPWSAMVL